MVSDMIVEWKEWGQANKYNLLIILDNSHKIL